ncbi:nucleotidyltransferase family protein [Microvirga brassicacearum]|uniref:nucleotidyltransferase family protein n=1 Tax=Microvirga brassicacearum TaxID=2580413 RepID=UPI0013912C8F|nr:nucleotidyltransferase family protein [Microvirga brassicacearum]
MATLRSTSVVVLAAGLSRRYGASNKLLASFGGKPLAMHIAQTLADLPFSRRIAVCAEDDLRLADLFIERGFEIARNANPERGQASSLSIGVRTAARTGPEAIVICLADMPFVPASVVKSLVRMIGKADAAGIVATAGVHACVAGPPAIFARAHFQSLMSLEGDMGARALLRAARILPVPDECLADFDTRQDFTT